MFSFQETGKNLS